MSSYWGPPQGDPSVKGLVIVALVLILATGVLGYVVGTLIMRFVAG